MRSRAAGVDANLVSVQKDFDRLYEHMKMLWERMKRFEKQQDNTELGFESLDEAEELRKKIEMVEIQEKAEPKFAELEARAPPKT